MKKLSQKADVEGKNLVLLNVLLHCVKAEG